MIYDTLDNTALYYSVHPLFKEAFKFLKDFDSAGYSESTKISLIGNELRAGVDFYATTAAESKKWEAHRNYIDIQCVFSGQELCGVAPVKNLTETDAYNPEKDVLFLKETKDSSPVYVPLEPGRFAVFFPGDAHKPGLHNQEDRRSDIIKVVVKIILNR